MPAKPQDRSKGQFSKLAPHRGSLLKIVPFEPEVTLKSLAETNGAEGHLSLPNRAASAPRPDGRRPQVGSHRLCARSRG